LRGILEFGVLCLGTVVDLRPFFLEWDLVSRLVFDKLDEGASGILCIACIQC